MIENKTNEVALPIIGQFKTKKKLLGFVSGTGTNIRFITHTAIIPIRSLTQYFEEDIQLRFTICEENTLNIEEEGDANLCKPDLLQRILDDFFDRKVVGYIGKYIISGLKFKDDDGRSCYLEIEQEKPINKLFSLFDEIQEEKDREHKISESNLS